MILIHKNDNEYILAENVNESHVVLIMWKNIWFYLTHDQQNWFWIPILQASGIEFQKDLTFSTFFEALEIGTRIFVFKNYHEALDFIKTEN